MSKILFPFLIVLALFAASCGTGGNNVSTASASWNVGTVAYSASNISRTGNIVNAFGTNGIALQFVFASIPTVSGTYDIVNEGSVAALTANQVAIQTNTTATDIYISTGSGNKTADVTVTNGKIKITFPAIEVDHIVSGPVLDSTTANGTLQE